MLFDLSGKTALVTGSSRGIGFEIARRLQDEGCDIILNGRDRQSLSDAARRLGGAVAIDGDVTDPELARYVVREAALVKGGLDILVCNVGSGKSVKPGLECPDEWHRVFATNLWSATNCVEAAQEPLAKSGGAVVCISSICGLEVVPGAPVTYSSAKAALNAFVRGVARPLGQKGIRINAIAPGNIIFETSVWQEKYKRNSKTVKKMLEDEVSLRRFGTPEEVADMVVFLVSDTSKFATGAVFTLDGGQVRSL